MSSRIDLVLLHCKRNACFLIELTFGLDGALLCARNRVCKRTIVYVPRHEALYLPVIGRLSLPAPLAVIRRHSTEATRRGRIYASAPLGLAQMTL